MLSTILANRRKAAELVTKAGELQKAAHKATRELSAAELVTFNAMHDEADKLLATIEQQERQRRAENQLGNLLPQNDGEHREPGTPAANRARVLRAFCLGETEGLRAEDRQLAKQLGIRSLNGARGAGVLRLRAEAPGAEVYGTGPRLREARRLLAEERAMGVGAPSTGGAAVASGFSGYVEVALLAHGGIRPVATVLRTAGGEDLPFPTVDDTANEGQQVDENTDADEGDVAMGAMILEAYKYSSKVVKVSRELLQDAAVNIEQLVGNLLGERVARITNRHFTNGTGVGQPRGAAPASFLGKAAAAAAAVTYAELVDLQVSLDEAYQDGASWQFKDTTKGALRKLVDTTGQPLWAVSPALEAPPTFMGKPYTVNAHMPAMATGLRSILYGNFSKYLVRDVMDLELIVLRERFATAGQVAFLTFSRHDGDLLDAGTHPVRHLLQA